MLQKLGALAKLQVRRLSLTIPGHELKFVDELYAWNEEG